MTATDTIRAMLDERGVEWWAEDDPEEPAYYFVTKWFANGCEQAYEEIPAIRSRSLNAYCVTPEQAIEATLGRGECRRVLYEPTGVLVCSECGAGIPKQLDKYCYLHYCPNCGRAVVA